MDEFTRDNANVVLGDTVTVMKAKAMQAEKVIIALPYPLPLDEGYFSIILDNRPLIKGDTVAVPYFGVLSYVVFDRLT
jgi:hypothetical protein